jgi:ribosomal protein S18 acetylase RimI-like enzyme
MVQRRANLLCSHRGILPKGTFMIIDVTSENLEEYPPTCFMNPDQQGFRIKRAWLEKRFQEGLRIKVLVDETDEKIHGLIEYVSGENAWRAVDARDYIFIHCLWVHPRTWRNRGFGSTLINEVMDDARGTLGVSVITSDGPFMASSDIFRNQGFEVVDEEGDYQLLVKQLHKGDLPVFKNTKEQQKKYMGWHILYSNQCPWVSRFIHELDPAMIDPLSLTITELKTPEQAQNAPSIYAAFNLIHDGKLLADHYISATRFFNIIKKETMK